MLAVLAGAPQRPGKPPPQLNAQQRLEVRRSKYYRWHYTTKLRRRGASLRSIARQVGASPATVLRDLRRSLDWASDQADRGDIREARERLRERQAGALGARAARRPPQRCATRELPRLRRHDVAVVE